MHLCLCNKNDVKKKKGGGGGVGMGGWGGGGLYFIITYQSTSKPINADVRIMFRFVFFPFS